MDFNKRIEGIKPYFKVFNICDGVAYILVNFPKKWSLFDKEQLCTQFNIAVEVRGEGTYFLCDVTEDINSIFDAIEYVITNNKALEEKTTLLQEKIKELGNLFAVETLDRLKTLEFTFSKKNSVKSKKNRVKTETEVIKEYDIEEELIKEMIPETLGEEVATEEKVSGSLMFESSPQTKKKTNKKVKVNKEEDSDLMNFAKGLVEDE